jgi:DNA-binding winged helix-turn-helix (wHTH) protein
MARENGPRPRILRFATLEADLQARELRKNGLKLKLHGQPFEVLAMLLERPGEVVNREQLRERLWPTDTFVDFDHGVNTAINRLREALGDSADNPHFIETLPRRGYRFIAPIESIPPVSAVTAASSSATPQAQPTPLPEADVQPRHGKRLVWILPAVLLFGVLVAANVGRFQRLFGEQPRTPIQSIAVLPLVNLSADPQQEHFTDGMTEERWRNR